MFVLKFGGTSIGSPDRMRGVADIILDGRPKIVVLSAVAGTTNKLVELAENLARGEKSRARSGLNALKMEYRAFVRELYEEKEMHEKADAVISANFAAIEACFDEHASPTSERIILAQGELMSTALFQIYLKQLGVASVLLPALEFMRTKENGEPDVRYITSHLRKLITSNKKTTYFITQGYICRNAAGEIDNLKRGGSDYTATIIGAAIQSEEIQIWTDIDGLHNNDPRVVERTFPVRKLSYREAAEVAYFGAKILHPFCVIPAEKRGVPIRLKNTFEPQAPGTLISAESSGEAIAAIAAKDGIYAIKIRSGRMLNAYGFLRRVFQVFEHYKTPIDMITTSEVAVSLTIDDPAHLDNILEDLKKFGEVSCDSNQTIICVVGDSLHERRGLAKVIFSALANIPIRMVSYGGSNNNVSVLVASEYKGEALRALNEALF
jgi:aspartate kinase